ncbi:MAG: hypothetical protein FJ221_14190 [Lentisphaerae bacterium]|nr:hypothetical protein [Lentisphaerota bacterium]
MNPHHRILDRLTAAARGARPVPANDLAPSTATRVLARLRERPPDRLWWEALAARAAVTACAAATVYALLPAPAPSRAGDDPVGVASAILITALNPE